MRYLKRCISLALMSHVAQGQAGELTISPTLELSYLHASMDNEAPNAYSHDDALNGQLNTVIDYSTIHWDSEFTHEITSYQYSKNKEADMVMNEFSWVNDLTYLDERFTVSHSWKRYRELYDALGGNFEDNFYNMKGDSVRNLNDVKVRYTSPTNWPFIFNIEGMLEDERIIPDKELETEKSKLLSKSANFSISDKHVKGIYWSAQGARTEQDKKDGLTFVQDSGNAVVRIPLVSKVNLTGKSSISRYESSTEWGYGNSDREVRTIVSGVGLSWVKSQNDAFIEATYDRVDDSDDGVSYSWGAEFAWSFADRWRLYGQKTARFYGDSYAANISYTGKRSTFTLTRDEDVRQRYVPVPQLVFEGMYACSANEFGEYVYDPMLCTPLPEDNTLEDGQMAVPNIQQQFPLEPRLNIERRTTASWRFKAQKWEHNFSVSRKEDEDLTSQLFSEGYEGRFDADYRLSSDSYLRMEWKYEDVEVDSRITSRSISRVGSLGYHKELNTRAEWSVTVKLTSQDNQNVDYDDARLILTYQHFFGEKHKRRRSF